MRFSFIYALMLMLVFGNSAHAQFWGTGMYGGMQACPYGYGPGGGATDESDEIQELREQRDKIRRELRETERKKAKLESQKSRARMKLSSVFTGGGLQMVTTHMEQQNGTSSYSQSCGQVASVGNSSSPTVTPEWLRGVANPGGTAQANANLQWVNDAFCAEWNGTAYNLWSLKRYGMDGGVVNPQACYEKYPGVTKSGASEDKRSECADGLNEYLEASQELAGVGEKIRGLRADLKAYDRMVESERDRMRAERDDETETGECVWCKSQRRGYQKEPSTFEKIASVALPVLGGVLAYKGAKYAIDQNARLGWPTQPYLAASMGYPFLMSGLYGAIGGGIGGGAFGCAGGAYGGGFGMGPAGMMGPYGPMGMGLYGGAGMGGPFGYPFGGGLGGGMYMPGMGPWGIPGPWGGGGMYGGFPGGFALGGGIGFAMGGMPMGGFPMGGMPMGGMMGGMPMGGMLGGGIGFAMGGMPMGGMPMGGMMGGMPMGGMMGGMPMGGMMGGMPMGGMMGGMPMGGAMGGFQYQQQMMQQYMMQMQSYMAYQQRVQQDYVMRQQTVMSLQQELYRIQMQIQQISMGGVGGGMSYGLGGPDVLPYPGPGTGGLPGGSTLPPINTSPTPNTGTSPVIRGR